MARIKYYDSVSGTWKYADGNAGGTNTTDFVKSVNGIEPDENGNINIEIPEIDVDSLAIKPDWNQNDENESDYIKNRTHWVVDRGIVETEIISECTFRPYPAGGVGVHYIGSLPSPVTLGATYIVTLNGTVYECAAHLGKSGFVSIGNETVYPGVTREEGEPFYIEYLDYNSEITVYLDNTNNNTMSIIKRVHDITYHTLDEKFIPDSIAKVSDLHNATTGVPDLIEIANRLFVEEVETVLDEHTISCEDTYDSAPYWFNTNPIPDLVRGDTYVVTWDETEYVCVAGDDGYGGEALGNRSIAELGVEDTGEPFFIYEEYLDSNDWCGVAALDAEIHTLKIAHKVKQISDGFIPDTIARIDDVVQIRPDLAQNDETAPNYVKGRTHWVEEVRNANGVLEVLPETTVQISIDWECDDYGCSSLGSAIIPIVADRMYVVNINNMQYELIAQCVSETCIVLGNPNIIGYSGNVELYDYCIEYNISTGKLYFNSYLSGYRTVRIQTGFEEICHKLDEKFIPDTIQRVGDKQLVLASSTPGSTKKFAITVTDDGTITATETA